jgi:hypothetical protein
MRTTFDLSEDLIEEVRELTGAKTKKRAIVIALEEFIKNARRAALRERLRQKKGFGLSAADLEKMRRG